MAQQGTTTVDFGAFPGKTDATVVVSGITGSPTLGEAWIIPVATADHSADEHWVDGPEVVAAVPSGGSMTVYARARVFDAAEDWSNTGTPRVWGQWTIGWVVN